MRDRTFHSLDELNAAIRPLLEQHNARRFQRLPYSRRELFEQIEQPALAPLPARHFPLQQTRVVTVQFNCHVELREDRHFYSVPWRLRTRDPRTTVRLLYDERTVSIYYDNLRDFALQPLDAHSRLALLEILEDRHGRASTLMVSQRPVSSWHEVIGEPTIADAICDRIVHAAHRINLEGDSVRKLYAQRANRDSADGSRTSADDDQDNVT